MKHTIFLIAVLISVSVPSFSQVSSEYKIRTIVLDAGHGGHDTGCRGAFSNEKDVTLSIVLKLGALIKKTYPGVKVIYTRQTDEFIELYERANIANRNDADLFISIHCNANKSTSPYGTETWLMGLHKSEGNLEVSKRENDVILMEDDYRQNYDGFDPNSPEGYIILSMNQNAHLDQSIALASKVEDEFIQDGRSSRGVKQAGFLVLWRTTMPSILIETGFLTNREEEKYLNSEKGQSEITLSVLSAIASYKREVEGGIDPLAVPDTQRVLMADTSKNIYEAQQHKAEPLTGSIITSPDSLKKSSAIIYKVQIAASEKNISLKDPAFAGIRDITNDKSDKGMNRYVVGNYIALPDCQTRLIQLKKKGFKDAFIVAYKEGKRVPVNQLP